MRHPWLFRIYHGLNVLAFARLKIHFKDSKGTLLKTVEANEGDDILSIAHEYDIDLEGKHERISHYITWHANTPH